VATGKDFLDAESSGMFGVLLVGLTWGQDLSGTDMPSCCMLTGLLSDQLCI